MSETDSISTDVLVIGGGAAGCAATVEARELRPDLEVTLVDKANITRSGCLAMGLNAINAYLHEGTTPADYVAAVERDAHGIIRRDLVRSIAEGVNEATHRVETWGLPIPRDADGRPFSKGPRSIRILGESLKPILARRVRRSGVRIIQRHSLVDFRIEGGRVVGAYFLGVRTGGLLEVRARAVILATGGAAGLYRTRNRGAAANRMWYSPYNTGAGYAATLRAGGELTTLEMRFIPTRIRHTAAPTGTLAQTFGAREENVLGEAFNDRYARRWGVERLTTPQRLRALVEEEKAGRGPVALRIGSGGKGLDDELLGAYLDMTPSQVALWAAEGFNPATDPVPIDTSGPYLLGGHTASGLWIDKDRRATLPGLYAAGDVAGGAPKKYVSGAWVEGFRAARTALDDLADTPGQPPRPDPDLGARRDAVAAPLIAPGTLPPAEFAERLQRVMDEFAGGVSTAYEIHGTRLTLAIGELEGLEADLDDLGAHDPHELLQASECRDRVGTARALVAHLAARTETRWPGYQTRVDHPDPNPAWECFVNSLLGEDGAVETFTRPLETGDGRGSTLRPRRPEETPCPPTSTCNSATAAGVTPSRPACAPAPGMSSTKTT